MKNPLNPDNPLLDKLVEVPEKETSGNIVVAKALIVPQEEIGEEALLALFKEKLAAIGEEELLKLLNEKRVKEVPRVELKGILHDPEKGIKIELDWNLEFIDHLRNNGITGASEEQIVQRWLAHLANDIARDMEEESGTISEYE